MRKKNGFTMAETIVSIAIILMISLVILKTTALCSKSILKSKSLNFGITQVDNVCKIYEKTDIVLGSEINYDTLKLNLNSFFGKNIVYNESAESGLGFEIVFDKSYKIDENGATKVNIAFTKQDGFLVMSGKVLLDDSVLYENGTIFKKVVPI